jgi:hypothetical protein
MTITIKGGGFLRAALERQRVAVVDRFRVEVAKAARRLRGDDEEYPDPDPDEEDTLL